MLLSSLLPVDSRFSPVHSVLTESCHGLDKSQRLIVEGIYNEFSSLVEATLDPDQIQQLFGTVEKQYTASGQNRTLLGRGIDKVSKGVDTVGKGAASVAGVASKVNQAINNAGKWLQNTTPVQAFDQKFENLKRSINTKFPDSKILDGVSKMGMWAKENPGKTAAVIGVLTTIAALGTGPVGGAVAAQILKGTAELMKGEKLSTAVGKGAKSAAVGALAGWSLEQIGDALSGTVKTVADNLFPDASKLNFRFYATGTGPNIFKNLTDVYALPDDAERLKRVWNNATKAWDLGNYSQARQLFDQAAGMAKELAKPEYLEKITQNTDKWETIIQGAEALSKTSTALAAAAQGAAGAAVDSKDKSTSQPRSMTAGQINEMFQHIEEAAGWDQFKTGLQQAGQGVKGMAQGAWTGTKDLAKQGAAAVKKGSTTKVTASSLKRKWEEYGKPTDSVAIARVLQDAGVPLEVVHKSFDTMNIPLAGTADNPGAGIQTGATALVDPETGRPYEKAKLAAKASQIRAAKQAAAAAPAQAPAAPAAQQPAGPTQTATATTVPAPQGSVATGQQPRQQAATAPVRTQPPSAPQAQPVQAVTPARPKTPGTSFAAGAGYSGSAAPTNVSYSGSFAPQQQSWANPTSPDYVGRREVARRQASGIQPTVSKTPAPANFAKSNVVPMTAKKAAAAPVQTTAPVGTSGTYNKRTGAATLGGKSMVAFNDLPPAIQKQLQPDLAECIRQVNTLLQQVTQTKDFDQIKEYIDKKFTKIGIDQYTKPLRRAILEHAVRQTSIRRRAWAKQNII